MPIDIKKFFFHFHYKTRSIYKLDVRRWTLDTGFIGLKVGIEAITQNDLNHATLEVQGTGYKLRFTIYEIQYIEFINRNRRIRAIVVSVGHTCKEHSAK